MADKKKMHFMWFSAFGPRPGEWQDPTAGNGYDWTQPEFWQDAGRALERGKFDLMLFSDILAVPDSFGGSMDTYLRTGQNSARHDPVPLVAFIAAVTKHIGLAATLSTTFYPPFLLARMFTTLDHLTRGRTAWNVVTSTGKLEAQNFGYEEILPHDERYDRADEYMDLCYKLWSSWDPDAVIMDRKNGIFADPAKVRPVNFEGQWYRSRGPLNATPSPQGKPVIFQAGSSNRGREFAARHAEAVIVSSESVGGMKDYYEDVKGRMVKYGRNPDDCKIFFLVKPVIAETKAAAEAMVELREKRSPVEAGLANLSSSLQMDVSQFPLDEPLPQLELAGVRGYQSTFSRYYQNGHNPTLREIAQKQVSGELYPMVGTAEDVADQMEELFEEIGGDGFGIREAFRPGYVSDIVDQLMPVLQDRGRARTEYTGTTLRENLLAF